MLVLVLVLVVVVALVLVLVLDEVDVEDAVVRAAVGDAAADVVVAAVAG